MCFAICMSLDNDEFNIIETHNFIIYILEYGVEKTTCYCFL